MTPPPLSRPPLAPESPLAAALRAHIEYLRDLGLYDLFRREAGESIWDLPSLAVAGGSSSQWAEQTPSHAAGHVPGHAAGNAAGQAPRQPPAQVLPQVPEQAPTAPPFPQPPQEPPIARPVLPVFTPGAFVPPEARPRLLEALRSDIGDCHRCPLGFAGRHSIVLGDGDPAARLFFVGEGPGADEDAQGLPFVGRAGQLLNNMISAMGLQREQVYIANVVKCRPPQNRTPEPVEAATCLQFLHRQLDLVRPAVIVALGSTAATYLLGAKSPLAGLRGRAHPAFGAKLIVTYHPAFLLRDPSKKKDAWADLQLAMRELSSTGA